MPDSKISEVQRLMEDYKRRFEFAYFLDSYEEEIRDERTVDTTQVAFRGEKRDYVVVDVPGHKEFIRNMLTGASHAQIAILVVSASEGIEEQTRRHTYLLKLLGIPNIIVAVNKMDAVNYSPQKFTQIWYDVAVMLLDYGYSQACYIPISALKGDNVYKPSKMVWYTGMTLVDTLDAIEVPPLEVKPLRFVVQDWDGQPEGPGLMVVLGRVESGVLEPLHMMTFEPQHIEGLAGDIIGSDGMMKDYAKAGESVALRFPWPVGRGNVGGNSGRTFKGLAVNTAPRVVHEFIAEVAVVKGFVATRQALYIRCGTATVPCQVEEIIELIDPLTGEGKAKQEAIETDQAGKVRFTCAPMVAEPFAFIPELGRFTLIVDEENIGAGIILEILK
jgi:small GTP-binding protein